MRLREEVYSWLDSYIKEKEIVQGVTNNIMYRFSKSLKARFALGVLVGTLLTLTLIAWLS